MSYSRPVQAGLVNRAGFNEPFRGGLGPAAVANRVNNLNRVNMIEANRNLFINRTANYYGGWNRGYWNGHGGRWGGNWGWYRPWGWGWGYPYLYGLGLGLGLGFGWGLSTWGLGAWPFYYGYMDYYNPYYAMAPAAVVINYAQPIDVTVPPPPQTDVEVGVALFDQARAAFKAGDYDRALQLADQAISRLPNDPDLHEFRAVVQFARGNYTAAAAGLYAVLTVGPGWNWATLISLYPDVDTFTRQLRALESFVRNHPDDAPSRFVLGYLYLTMGWTDAAEAQLREVVRLVPNDWLSKQLLSEIEKKERGDDTTASAAAATADGTTTGPADVSGRWTAKGARDGTITLELDPDGKFTWTYTAQGQSRSFRGTYTYGNGLLTLAPQDGPPIVGRVTWEGQNRFTFRLAGSGPGDPGLTFSR
jgi:tetratricopeptide (TPR) repeat protein